MVGHYQEDMIVSAEKELDKQLERRLTERFNMGVYPGRVGTDRNHARSQLESARRCGDWIG